MGETCRGNAAGFRKNRRAHAGYLLAAFRNDYRASRKRRKQLTIRGRPLFFQRQELLSRPRPIFDRNTVEPSDALSRTTTRVVVISNDEVSRVPPID